MAKLTKDGTEWTYTYDANGMRTERSGGGETYQYLYSGSQLRQMTVDGHTLEFDYDANGHPLTVIYDGDVYFYVTNLQGDVVGIVDGGGAQVAGYTYTAWGEYYETGGSHQTTLGKLNPLRYRGYVYDVETGLYYLQSRYYNPQWGRFLNADSFASTGQGMLGNNMFSYCLNNPISYFDPSGTRCVLNSRGIRSGENDVPYKGEPGSHVISPDGTKERIYGPDGLPQRDRHHSNHGNEKEHPDVPHDHDWGFNENGKWEPGKGYPSPPGPLKPKVPSFSSESIFDTIFDPFPNPETGDMTIIEIIIDFLSSLFQ